MSQQIIGATTSSGGLGLKHYCGGNSDSNSSMKKDPENVFTGCSSDRECVLYIENVNGFCAQAIQARFDDRDATTAATSCFLCATMPVCASMPPPYLIYGHLLLVLGVPNIKALFLTILSIFDSLSYYFYIDWLHWVPEIPVLPNIGRGGEYKLCHWFLKAPFFILFCKSLFCIGRHP